MQQCSVEHTPRGNHHASTKSRVYKVLVPKELTLALGWEERPCGHTRQLAVHRYTGPGAAHPTGLLPMSMACE